MKSVGECLANMSSLLQKIHKKRAFLLFWLLLYLAVLAWNGWCCLAWNGWCCLATVLRMKPHTEEGVAERNAERYV